MDEESFNPLTRVKNGTGIVYKGGFLYKLGVLMAVHGGDDAALFRRAVLSIANQKLLRTSEIRIYLGVDGQIGELLERTLDEMASLFYRVFRFTESRGLVHILNELLASREDEHFYFRMDADDFSMPYRFQRQLEYMDKNPDIEILGTDIVEVDETTGRRHVVHFADSPKQARRNIARGVPVAHPTVCFRASAFHKVPRYPAVLLNEDIEMWFACLRAGIQFDNVPEPLYEFRITENFWNRRGLNKTWTEFSAYVSGIWLLDGLTWQYVFPIARLVLRLAPASVKRLAYRSRLRKSKPVPLDVLSGRGDAAG